MAQQSRPTQTHATLVQYIARHAHVHCFSGSMQKHEHGYTMEPRVIGDYNLLFVTRGRVVWEIENEPVTLEPQSLLMVRPGPRHHAYSLTKRVTLLSIHMAVKLPGGVDVLDLLRPKPLQQVIKNSRLDRYLRGLLSDYEGKSICQRQELLPGWTSLIVHEMLHELARNEGLSANLLDPMITLLLDRLNDCYDQPLTLDEIATWAGYTPQHTNRLFKQVLGVTPLKYLMQLRMNRAASMLAENVLSVHAVGEHVGFDDPYYFSRMFRQYHGRSPQQYQQLACSDYPSRISTSPLG